MRYKRKCDAICPHVRSAKTEGRLRRILALGSIVAMVTLPMALRACRGRLPAMADYARRPYPPGGGNDLIARLVAGKMSFDLGQPIALENRGGAAAPLGLATWREAHRTAIRYSLPRVRSPSTS